jgi:hypothetical protein
MGAQDGHWKEPYVWCDCHRAIPPKVPLKKQHTFFAMKKILYFCLQLQLRGEAADFIYIFCS